MWPELKARRSSSLESKEIRCPSPKTASVSWAAGCPRRILKKHSTSDFRGA
uniref:Phosphoenolpyruvate carboxykinase 1 variant 3 n=1 Tax=Bos taurus TaxID=9913 RepID=I6V930_BOVIN|nr:phosphoenolpyruvate carboxykinase 1 variant 3 [Bos taurus]